jgi:hypothetical protein
MRKPFVAGGFYPRAREGVEKLLAKFEARVEARFRKEKISAGKVFAVVSPHAGWVYSGFTAMHSYKAIQGTLEQEKAKAPLFVLIGPNHTGLGAPLSLSMQDWETPLGVARVDEEFGHALLKHSSLLEKDEDAHLGEHSIEVQVPFLQWLFREFTFAPICMGDQSPSAARAVAKAVLEAEKETGRRAVVVASSDFTHFEPVEQARKKDFWAIEALEALDASEWFRRVEEKGLSICGFGPIGVAVEYAKAHDAKRGVVLHFSNSAEVTGEQEVVDYASIIFQF